jgi:CRISPR/Cas system-associated protein Cas7 (RAMP superfamily)
MEKQIRSRIIDMTRQNQDIFANEAGVQSSLNVNKVKEYLHEVLKEVQKGKAQNVTYSCCRRSRKKY